MIPAPVLSPGVGVRQRGHGKRGMCGAGGMTPMLAPCAARDLRVSREPLPSAAPAIPPAAAVPIVPALLSALPRLHLDARELRPTVCARTWISSTSRASTRNRRSCVAGRSTSKGGPVTATRTGCVATSSAVQPKRKLASPGAVNIRVSPGMADRPPVVREASCGPLADARAKERASMSDVDDARRAQSVSQGDASPLGALFRLHRVARGVAVNVLEAAM